MTIMQIIQLLKKYLAFAIIIMTFISGMVILFYKKILKKQVDLKNFIIPYIFSIYSIVIIGATFFSRNLGHTEIINFKLFSSYKEAYYSGLEQN